jgi:hypothetical protein
VNKRREQRGLTPFLRFIKVLNVGLEPLLMVIWITRLDQRGHAGFPPKKWTPQRRGEPKVLNVGLTPFLH